MVRNRPKFSTFWCFCFEKMPTYSRLSSLQHLLSFLSVHEERPPSDISCLRRKQVLQAEIQDETDTCPAAEGNNSRRGAHRVELDRYLSMFEHKLAAARALSPQEIQAIAAFLSASVQEFAGLASSNVALKVGPKISSVRCCSRSH